MQGVGKHSSSRNDRSVKRNESIVDMKCFKLVLIRLLRITSKYMTVMHPVLDHVNVAVLQCNDIKGMCNYCLASDVNEKEANVSPQLGKVLMLFLASYCCRYNFEKFHLFLSFVPVVTEL